MPLELILNFEKVIEPEKEIDYWVVKIHPRAVVNSLTLQKWDQMQVQWEDMIKVP